MGNVSETPVAHKIVDSHTHSNTFVRFTRLSHSFICTSNLEFLYFNMSAHNSTACFIYGLSDSQRPLQLPSACVSESNVTLRTKVARAPAKKQKTIQEIGNLLRDHISGTQETEIEAEISSSQCEPLILYLYFKSFLPVQLLDTSPYSEV